MKAFAIGFALSVGCAQSASLAETAPAKAHDAVIARHAAANGVPEALVRRVIQRESKYNPKARNGPHMGMMQISAATARSMGYRGAPAGLLDPDVNLTYAVRYLAGAYRTAGGDHDRAVRYYSRGYYYDAKRKGLLASIGLGRDGKFKGAPEIALAAGAPASTPGGRPTQLAAASTARPASSAPPPVRGAATMVVAVAAAPGVPVPQPRDVVASPIAANRTSVPPTGPAALASAGAATDQTVTGSIMARGAAPIPPVRPAAPPPQRPRVISSAAQPALASAGQVAPEAEGLAYSSADSAPTLPRGPVAPMPPRR